MKKLSNITGFKSYLFTVSLVLFFLGALVMTNNVLAACTNNQQYSCYGILTYDGEIVADDDDSCIYLCLDNFEVDLYYDYFHCYLFPTDSKHMLGTVYDPAFHWGGCSVERRGGTLITKVTYVENGEGYIGIVKCKPCNDCCL